MWVPFLSPRHRKEEMESQGGSATRQRGQEGSPTANHWAILSCHLPPPGAVQVLGAGGAAREPGVPRGQLQDLRILLGTHSLGLVCILNKSLRRSADSRTQLSGLNNRCQISPKAEVSRLQGAHSRPAASSRSPQPSCS